MTEQGVISVWPDAVDVYVDALGAGNRPDALDVVRGLRTGGYDARDIMTHLLGPAQQRIGQLWVEDLWSVAREHAATAISEAAMLTLALELDQLDRRAGRLADDTSAPPPLVIVACVEQEWHSLPALMVAEHLRADGFAVSYLGANSSAQHLVRHIREVRPSAVLLSCSLSAFLPLVRRHVEAVRATGLPIVLGGAAFDGDARRAEVLGATAFHPTGAGIAEVVHKLPAAVPVAEPLAHPGVAEGYVIFGDREALADEAERALLQLLGAQPASTPTGDDPWLHVLDDQMPHLVGSVAGALVCGDRSVIDASLTWAETVLRNRAAPEEAGVALRLALHTCLRDMPVAAGMLLPR